MLHKKAEKKLELYLASVAELLSWIHHQSGAIHSIQFAKWQKKVPVGKVVAVVGISTQLLDNECSSLTPYH